MDAVNAQQQKNGKNPSPSYAIIDSQSVKTVAASEQRGLDGGKQVKGRKHPIVVDTLGNLIQVLIHAANQHDTRAGCRLSEAAANKHASIQAFSEDESYRGSSVELGERTLGLKLGISKEIKDTFAVLPIRWIAERTFAWLGNYIRLSKAYEILTSSAEDMVRIAMIHLTIAKCL